MPIPFRLHYDNPTDGAASGAATASAAAKHRTVEAWVARQLGSVEHERRVAEIAGRMFHLTRALHGLALGDLRLLQLAAVVHDVGRAVCDETHPEDGARMVLSEAKLPLDDAERRQLAYLTRYHRGRVPEAGADEILWPADDADRLLRVLALLRASDALDGRSIESPRIILALAGSRTPRLQVSCYLENDSAKARKVYGRRKKFRLLEEQLGCRVEITIAHAAALAMVA
jgi:exopolyphosphatase/guanosine-5'-triphosphate,3'-diphosphate pyrophosphatase